MESLLFERTRDSGILPKDCEEVEPHTRCAVQHSRKRRLLASRSLTVASCRTDSWPGGPSRVCRRFGFCSRISFTMEMAAYTGYASSPVLCLPNVSASVLASVNALNYGVERADRPVVGLSDFQGRQVHSAGWDHNYDYSFKRIAIIGNGSSGIQILPEMARLPGTQVISFQRGPTWVRISCPFHFDMF